MDTFDDIAMQLAWWLGEFAVAMLLPAILLGIASIRRIHHVAKDTLGVFAALIAVFFCYASYAHGPGGFISPGPVLALVVTIVWHLRVRRRAA